MAELRAFCFNCGDFAALVRAKGEEAEEMERASAGNDTEYKKYSFNARHSVQSDHSIPKGDIVDMDGVTDEISRALRELIRK